MRELEVKLSVDDPFVTPPLAQAATGVAGMQERTALGDDKTSLRKQAFIV